MNDGTKWHQWEEGETTVMQGREGDPRRKSWVEMVSNRSKKL